MKKNKVSRILLFLAPLVRFIDKTFTHKHIHKKIFGGHYFLLRDKIDAGAVLLTQTEGPASNAINPSKINHAGIYFGFGLRTHIEILIESTHDDELRERLNKIQKDYKVQDSIAYVIESVGRGSVPTDLVTFMTTKDHIIAVKPNFCSPEKALDASRRAVYDLGLAYDYAFSHQDDMKYCFELCADAYERTVEKKLKRKSYKVFGIEIHNVFLSDTFTTSDWDEIFDTDKIKFDYL